MTPGFVWSLALAAIGILGIWLAGRKDPRGWLIGVGAQVLWAIYATVTWQPGFYFSAAAYGWVYFANWRKWRREQCAQAPLEGDGGPPLFSEDVENGLRKVLVQPPSAIDVMRNIRRGRDE